MTWLYIPPQALAADGPCSGCRCAPAPAASISACTSPSPDTVLWVTSSGTPAPRPSSWPGWKTRPWRRRLSGTTLPASTAAHGVARWISCWRAIRASRSASPAAAAAPTTRATCGHMSPASSANADLDLFCSRTSPTTSTSAIAMSAASWRAWASALRKDCSRRRRSARRTGASACSCSAWPTPTLRGNHNRRGASAKAGDGLATTARNWPTPKASDGNRPSAGNRLSADLTGRARCWATPSARDWKSAHASPATLARDSRPLNEQAVNLCFRPDPPTRPAGATTCAGARMLNPAFVEALMGWPAGWTGFDCVATAWCRWLPRMRGELSRLGWES